MNGGSLAAAPMLGKYAIEPGIKDGFTVPELLSALRHIPVKKQP